MSSVLSLEEMYDTVYKDPSYVFEFFIQYHKL